MVTIKFMGILSFWQEFTCSSGSSPFYAGECIWAQCIYALQSFYVYGKGADNGISESLNIRNFRGAWLENFFERATSHGKIPTDIHTALARKLGIINTAVSHRDLRSPPDNRYEEFIGRLQEYSSIRVSKQYRLIFKVGPKTRT